MEEVIGIIEKELSREWMKKVNNVNKLENSNTTA
jgi:hypothetical protein